MTTAKQSGMKILMLGWELPPHISGGLGVACYNMSKALAIQGSEIDFVVPYTAPHPDIKFMKIHSATKLSPNQRNGLGAYDSSVVMDKTFSEADANDLSDMRGVQKRYAKFVAKLVKKIKPDVIHAHDWLTYEAGVLAKQVSHVPLVVHVHATEFDRSGGGTGNPLVREIESQGLMMADRIIAVSNITKNIIISKYGIPAENIEVVYNAVDIDGLSDGYIYDYKTYNYLEHLKSKGHTIIVTITRLTVQKGLVNFLNGMAKACKMHDKLVFLIAGTGELRDELLELAADLGIADKIFFTGFITGKRWRDAYSVGDIFIMSSISEPFGITALEAAHHGNALILTKQSGVGEVLNNVMRYDFWDEEKLANQLVGIATSPALQSSLQENVHKEYLNISWFDAASLCTKAYGHARKGLAV